MCSFVYASDFARVSHLCEFDGTENRVIFALGGKCSGCLHEYLLSDKYAALSSFVVGKIVGWEGSENYQYPSDMRVLSSAEIFAPTGCELGESPFWHDGRLWWVDITRGHLHSTAIGQKKPTMDAFGQRIGAAAPLGGERFILALERDIVIYDRSRDDLSIAASHETTAVGVRFNDGKCDPWGRFLVGTLSESESAPTCHLYSYTGGREMRTLLPGVILSNGLAWTKDGGTLYYIDSMRYEVAAFSYDLHSGALGERRIVVRVPQEAGVPDGMDIDAEGNLWIAHWGGSSVRCWSPCTGHCLAEIPLPCSQPTSCCFGGPAHRTLFITTAREGLSPNELTRQPMAGHVFSCEVGVEGHPVHVFREHQ